LTDETTWIRIATDLFAMEIRTTQITVTRNTLAPVLVSSAVFLLGAPSDLLVPSVLLPGLI
jgi:hypothetical protein